MGRPSAETGGVVRFLVKSSAGHPSCIGEGQVLIQRLDAQVGAGGDVTDFSVMAVDTHTKTGCLGFCRVDVDLSITASYTL